MTNLETLRSFYDKIWVAEDLDAIPDLFSADVAAEGVMDFAVGPEDFHVMAETLLAQICIDEVRFDRTVELEDWTWVNFTALARRRDNNTPFEVSAQVMARFENGKIVEAYNQVDFLTLFEKLGYLPKDTLILCMSGEGIN